MEKRITILYDVVTQELKISENDFSTFEAFGILEAAKAIITENWLRKNNP